MFSYVSYLYLLCLFYFCIEWPLCYCTIQIYFPCSRFLTMNQHAQWIPKYLNKDIFDFLWFHGERSVLSGAVTVRLNHQHQKVAVWYLLHHKHPEAVKHGEVSVKMSTQKQKHRKNITCHVMCDVNAFFRRGHPPGKNTMTPKHNNMDKQQQQQQN